MSFQYWEYKIEEEKRLALAEAKSVTAEATAAEPVTVEPVTVETVSDTETVQLCEPRKKKSVARCIFVDGLLGLPFITVMLIIISALVAVFTIVTLVCGFGALAAFGGSILAIAYAFISFGSAVASALFMLGTGLVLGALSCLLIVTTALLGSRCVPFIASLYVRLVKKLHLFR